MFIIVIDALDPDTDEVLTGHFSTMENGIKWLKRQGRNLDVEISTVLIDDPDYEQGSIH